ncbi:MAG: Glutamate synthase [NADPH] small chain [Candidatus Izimaplasma bacterium HR2]|nr:MAG: Glutamate synthase [NADPH] small chain [Candidatus Izimaplasma bacterium HR2]
MGKHPERRCLIMSAEMRPIPFGKLINWMKTEYQKDQSIFGIHVNKFYKNTSGKMIEMFGDKISSPVGPAAGPNSQLAQNIVAAYLAGARFMELKTVQIMDGEELAACIPRPCINVEDEGYNVEWSTELKVVEARDEYVKAWFAIHVVAKELGISDIRDFIFNISVGYTLEGIKTPKIDGFISDMLDASDTEIWKECKQFLLENIDVFDNVSIKDIENIEKSISPSITISTMHGCPPEEINSIVEHLVTVKGMHTYVKCNPTLLGYDYARNTLDKLGYDYLSFDDHHFNDDLQWKDAIPMFTHLQKLAKENGLVFGLKLTNTFPVQIKRDELPGEEMYMSGRALFPLSISLAQKLTEAFDGEMPLSYSGGADALNIETIFETGIRPVTVCTTILKPGGYERLKQMAEICEPLLDGGIKKISIDKLTTIVEGLPTSKYNQKYIREIGSRKSGSELPLFDCFKSPCNADDVGCPIEQQIPEYLKLVSEGKYKEAFDVISIDNAAPAITGTICDHQCQSACTRVDYEESLSIRDVKKVAVLAAQDNFIKETEIKELKTAKKVAVIGAGVGGTATALFLRRNGVHVDVFEKRDKPMGVVTYIIPEFRIATEMIERDYNLAVAAGVNFNFNVAADFDVNELKKDYDYVVIAIGSWLKGYNPLNTGKELALESLDFLEKSKDSNLSLDLGKHVVVVGGGDVSMDCARSAIRTAGVEDVTLIYRRIRQVMPATTEEFNEAIEDGVVIKFLTSPIEYDGKTLTCVKNELVNNKAKSTDETFTMECDTIINAIGTKVDKSAYERNNIELNEWGYPQINNKNETSLENVYVAGDGKAGAKTIVKAVADAKLIAIDVLDKLGLSNDFVRAIVLENQDALYDKKGTLQERLEAKFDGLRCLTCDQVCDICSDVCPNRANISINVDSDLFDQKQQIIHVDGMCNECGNCGTFCPHSGRPYKDKITLFWTEHDFVDSTNVGFLPLSENQFKVRDEKGNIFNYTIGDKTVSEEVATIIDAVVNEYSYLMM